MASTPAPAYRKKLIEVDLPLAAINKEAAREKSLRHGHPSTLHLWWARRPLAACRAVVFASMVDDPSSLPEEFPTTEAQNEERAKLHGIIEKLVVWENSADESLLAKARWEIARSVARARNEAPPPEDDPAAVLGWLAARAPAVYDPFCGGGSIPLEAQRLGLRAVGTDLNPVAVLITKALIELPPKFRDRPPANPDADPMGMTAGKGRNARRLAWRGAAGLADDIRWYGRWMRERAWERIGHLYPPARLPDGGEATVIAWLWARTVPCPNPACGVAMPLMTTFQISANPRNRHWTRPVADATPDGSVAFEVQNHARGVPDGGTVGRMGATCVVCGVAAPLSSLKEHGRAGTMGESMTGIVAEGSQSRLFLSPIREHEQAALSGSPSWRPSGRLPQRSQDFPAHLYGVMSWSDMFTERQLTALTAFADILTEARIMIADRSGEDYADTIVTYLALVIGRAAHGWSKFSRWRNAVGFADGVFSRQAIPMIWDFAEANPFSESTQNWLGQVEWVAKVLEKLPAVVNPARAHQANAAVASYPAAGPIIVTDPPYYDNIRYADLSDFFYGWLRYTLRDVHPELFAGIATPKDEEMVAVPRFENPQEHFEKSLSLALSVVRDHCTSDFPSSLFYAYKQQEEERNGTVSTGWDTMLTALVSSGFTVVATWPMRTELANRSRAVASNALATSVLLVCRPRPPGAPYTTRQKFFAELKERVPKALEHLTRDGHIAPVDLAQAAIGPGMEVYSRYAGVETIAGEPVTVRDALEAINDAVADYHQREQGRLDAPSRFCADWLRQHGMGDGPYGDAETLARTHNVEVEALAPRLLTSEGGRVQLLPLESDAWAHDPQLRLEGIAAWEGAFRMAHALDGELGDRGAAGAAEVARAMGSGRGMAERLARILYAHFDARGDSRNAVRWNRLAASWREIEELATSSARQPALGLGP